MALVYNSDHSIPRFTMYTIRRLGDQICLAAVGNVPWLLLSVKFHTNPAGKSQPEDAIHLNCVLCIHFIFDCS